jgi:hypothetical protein
MSPFNFDILIWPGAVIFFATLTVSLIVKLNLSISILLSFIKAGIYIAYFGYFFDSTYTFFDDWSYLDGGREIFHRDIGLTNLWDNWDFVLIIGRGDHFIYYLYNAYAINLFGDGYYAPVALNVIMTIAVAYLGKIISITEFLISEKSARLFYSFLLLHPDILAWSNIMNGKDILILLLHVLILFSVSFYCQNLVVKAIIVALPTTLILLFTRYYVPVMFSIALIVSLIISGGRRRFFDMVLFVGSGVLFLFYIGQDGFQYIAVSLNESFVNPIYGLIRAILTPFPFNTDDNYAFLNFPALFHWILFPFAMYGYYCVWHINTPFTRFFLVYLLVFIFLYAVYGELQGPRHRVQLDYALAVLQFIGTVSIIQSIKKLIFH